MKGGKATLNIDGTKVDGTLFDINIPLRISLDETLYCGKFTATPVSDDYKAPFRLSE